MADLLTHYVSSRIAGIGLRDRATPALFGFGALFPDLLGKPMGEIPGLPHLAAVPTHTPLGLFLVCGAVSMLFGEELRKRAFWAIYLGSLLHVAVDLMKDYLGRGSVVLFHPFSTKSWEGGWYRSEDVLTLLPVNLLVLGAIWVLHRRRNRARTDVTVP